MKIGPFTVLLPDFNKPHRCPGWSGPGFVTGEKYDTGCPGGHIHVYGVADEHGVYPYVWDLPWRFGLCDECGVRTFPYALRWLNWRWLHHVLIWKNKIRFGNWWDEVQYNHGWGRWRVQDFEEDQ